MFPTLNKLNLNPKIKTHNGLAASVGVKTYSLQIFLLPIINEPWGFKVIFILATKHIVEHSFSPVHSLTKNTLATFVENKKII